jgi:hypothetical protein
MSTGPTAFSVKDKFLKPLADARDALSQFADNERNWHSHMKDSDKQDDVKKVAPLVKEFATGVKNALKEAKAFEKVAQDAKQMQALSSAQIKTRLTVFVGMCKKLSETGLKLQAALKAAKYEYWNPMPAKLMTTDKEITTFSAGILNGLKMAVGQIK